MEQTLLVAQAGSGMGDAQAEYEVFQEEKAAEQQAILNSIISEAEVVVNCRCLHD